MSRETEGHLTYLDTSVFAGSVLLEDDEDRSCALLIRQISNNLYDDYTFITSVFTLIELAELIARKRTKDKAKAILFDIMYDPNLPIQLVNPEPVHKTWGQKDYFDIDKLVANLVNTALEYGIPGFDTIHAHTIRRLDSKVIAISKDVHFNRFKKIKNVTDVVIPSEFAVRNLL